MEKNITIKILDQEVVVFDHPLFYFTAHLGRQIVRGQDVFELSYKHLRVSQRQLAANYDLMRIRFLEKTLPRN